MVSGVQVNKDLIKKRKEEYGNNFPSIAEAWSGRLDIEITQQMVAIMMADLKRVRLSHLALKVKTIDSKHYPAYKDSLEDLENYLWIADNYEEYLKL